MGTFYPADPRRLVRAVDRFLEAAPAWRGERPWAIVVPHAGYRYSGSVAAVAYAALRPYAQRIRSVASFGPAHFVPLEACAVPEAHAWRTPLGDVAIDPALRAAALGSGCVLDDRPHAPEHALEVQLPFLQRLAGAEVRVLPVAVGRVATPVVAETIDAIGARADLVVVSTDLSHDLDLGSARAADRRTADAVVAGEAARIGPADACGVYALRGLVASTRAAGRVIRLLELRTSGDTAGDPDRVVGYGAFAVGERA
jgi:AmmeMemoRadiSam system protein B